MVVFHLRHISQSRKVFILSVCKDHLQDFLPLFPLSESEPLLHDIFVSF